MLPLDFATNLYRRPEGPLFRRSSLTSRRTWRTWAALSVNFQACEICMNVRRSRHRPFHASRALCTLLMPRLIKLLAAQWKYRTTKGRRRREKIGILTINNEPRKSRIAADDTLRGKKSFYTTLWGVIKVVTATGIDKGESRFEPRWIRSINLHTV